MKQTKLFVLYNLSAFLLTDTGASDGKVTRPTIVTDQLCTASLPSNDSLYIEINLIIQYMGVLGWSFLPMCLRWQLFLIGFFFWGGGGNPVVGHWIGIIASYDMSGIQWTIMFPSRWRHRSYTTCPLHTSFTVKHSAWCTFKYTLHITSKQKNLLVKKKKCRRPKGPTRDGCPPPPPRAPLHACARTHTHARVCVGIHVHSARTKNISLIVCISLTIYLTILHYTVGIQYIYSNVETFTFHYDCGRGTENWGLVLRLWPFHRHEQHRSTLASILAVGQHGQRFSQQNASRSTGVQIRVQVYR